MFPEEENNIFGCNIFLSDGGGGGGRLLNLNKHNSQEFQLHTYLCCIQLIYDDAQDISFLKISTYLWLIYL